MRAVVARVAAAALVLVAPVAAATRPDLAATLTDGRLAVVDEDGGVVAIVAQTRPGTAAPAMPAWSPDGTRLAFEAAGIAVADLERGTVTKLTTESSDSHPAWSPDSTRIAFLRSAERGTDVWLVPTAGGGAVPLTRDGGFKEGLEWQPHGPLVLYWGGPTAASVSVVDATTGAVSTLAPGSSGSWSPDGSSVALVTPSREVVALRDRRVRTIAHADDGHAIGAYSPQWSPDGARIAFTLLTLYASTKFGVPTTPDVYIGEADGSGTRALTRTRGDEPWRYGLGSSSPRWWGPNRLLFQTRRKPGELHVWSMNSDGSCQSAFGRGAAFASVPVQSPVSPGPPPIVCTAAGVRIEASDVMGLRDETRVRVVVSNDGTLPLRAARLRIRATTGTVHVRGGDAHCTHGASSLCDLGDIGVQRSVAVTVLGRVKRPGAVEYTAEVASNGPGDIDPARNVAKAIVTALACDIVGTNGDDRLTGTRVHDRICGRDGADHVDGRGGADVIHGGAGADVVQARDGIRDTIDCGGGLFDVALVDQRDRVRSCERVLRRRVARR